MIKDYLYILLGNTKSVFLKLEKLIVLFIDLMELEDNRKPDCLIFECSTYIGLVSQRDSERYHSKKQKPSFSISLKIRYTNIPTSTLYSIIMRSIKKSSIEIKLKHFSQGTVVLRLNVSSYQGITSIKLL